QPGNVDEQGGRDGPARQLVQLGGAHRRPPQPSATARTGASPLAAAVQLRPASCDRNTQPSSLPIAAVSPRAARQPVATLSGTPSGGPSRPRSNGHGPSRRRRWTAARRPWWPAEALTSTVSPATATARQ